MNTRLTTLGIFACFTALSSTAIAETPTAVELLPLIPSLSTEGDESTSFQLKCQCLTHDHIPTEIDVRWRTDGRYSFLLADAATHTPIACFSHDGFAVYDALERTITFGPEVTPEFHLFASDDSNIKIEISWNQPDAKEPDPVSFKFDLRSFAARDGLTVKPIQSDRSLKMSNPSPSGKSYAVWEFAINPKIAFESFSIVWKENDTPMVRITEVKTGKGIATLLAPESVADESAIRAIPWKPNGMPSFVELITDVFDAIGGHAALTNAKYRQLKSYNHITDWDSVVDQCQDDRPTVMALFSVADDLSE